MADLDIRAQAIIPIDGYAPETPGTVGAVVSVNAIQPDASGNIPITANDVSVTSGSTVEEAINESEASAIATSEAYTDGEILDNIGLTLHSDGVGALAAGVLTFTDSTSVLKHNVRYNFDLSYTASEAPDGATQMVLTDSAGNQFNLVNRIEGSSTVPCSTASMRQVATYDGTAFRYQFSGVVRIVDSLRAIEVDNVVNPLAFARRFPLLMTGDEMTRAEVDGKLGEYAIPVNQIVIASTDNGFTLGNIYIFTDDGAGNYSFVPAYATA